VFISETPTLTGFKRLGMGRHGKLVGSDETRVGVSHLNCDMILDENLRVVDNRYGLTMGLFVYL